MVMDSTFASPIAPNSMQTEGRCTEGIFCSTVRTHNSKTLRSVGFIQRGQLTRIVVETGQFNLDTAERQPSVRQTRTHTCHA